MVRKCFLGRKLLILAIIVLIATIYTPVTVFAAANPTVDFKGAYDDSTNILTVKALIKNPDCSLGSGAFFLKYDTSVLTITEKDVKAGNAKYQDDGNEYSIVSLAKFDNSDKGYIGIDWGSSGKAFVPNDSYSEIAVFSFGFVSGKSNNDLNKNSITICEDSAFLDESNDYGNDGGILLCDATTYYSTKRSNVDVKIDLPVTDQDKKDRIMSLDVPVER